MERFTIKVASSLLVPIKSATTATATKPTTDASTPGVPSSMVIQPLKSKGNVLEGTPGAVLQHLQTFTATQFQDNETYNTEALLTRLYEVYDDASAMQNKQDVTAMDERRLKRLRLQYSHLSSRALLIVGQIVMYSKIFNPTPVTAAATKNTAALVADDVNQSKITTAINSKGVAIEVEVTPATTKNTNTTSILGISGFTKGVLTKGVGTAPRTLSQLMARQSWISEQDKLGWEHLFALLRTKLPKKTSKQKNKKETTSSKKLEETSAYHDPSTNTAYLLYDLKDHSEPTEENYQQYILDSQARDTLRSLPEQQETISFDRYKELFTIAEIESNNNTLLLQKMSQLAQTLQRILLHCCQESRDNELLATHQKVSLIIQRWIKDYTIGKENELYTESVALSTFKEVSNSKRRSGTRMEHCS